VRSRADRALFFVPKSRRQREALRMSTEDFLRDVLAA